VFKPTSDWLQFKSLRRDSLQKKKPLRLEVFSVIQLDVVDVDALLRNAQFCILM